MITLTAFNQGYQFSHCDWRKRRLVDGFFKDKTSPQSNTELH